MDALEQLNAVEPEALAESQVHGCTCELCVAQFGNPTAISPFSLRIQENVLIEEYVVSCNLD